MKTAAIIMLTILFIGSLSLNVWSYTEMSNLNDNIASQLGTGYSGRFQLPTKTMSQLKSNHNRLISLSRELERKYQTLREEYDRLEIENRRYQQLERDHAVVERNYEILAQEYKRVQAENQQYETMLTQIKREAEQAQQLKIFTRLLGLIFSLL